MIMISKRLSETEYEWKRAHLYFNLSCTRSLQKEKQLRKEIEELENAWYLQNKAKHVKDESNGSIDV